MSGVFYRGEWKDIVFGTKKLEFRFQLSLDITEKQNNRKIKIYSDFYLSWSIIIT